MALQERLDRNKETQEFFTPKNIIQDMMKDIPAEHFKSFCKFKETSCGNGNIVIEVINEFKKYHKIEDILEKLQLADYQEDNCIETIKRILGDDTIIEVVEPPEEYATDGLIKMFMVNGKLAKWIVQADSTTFNWWELSEREQQLENLGFEF